MSDRRVFNIPIFVPHLGCPFDCVFCNQKHITGTQNTITSADVAKIIETHLKTLPEKDRYVEAAFFGGSFTGVDKKLQCELLGAAYEYIKNGKIDGIRISTRPDYVSEEILENLKNYGVTTIELGVQSMAEDVLAASCRGHGSVDVEKAVCLIKQYPFQLGLQMMTGLPKDTPEKSIFTANKLIALKPDFARIYPTLVVKDTYLEKQYKKGEYIPQTLDEAVSLCKKLLLMFSEANIPVVRIALMTTKEISPNGSVVAGPFHSSFRELVESSVYYDKIEKLLQGHKNKVAVIKVNEKEISKAVGNKRENIRKIYKNYGIRLKIQGNPILKKGEIVLV
ncbi:MAG: radical SAM protein [Clostridia bacterium]|nr:radical SAM protein [Clostridia bacterium]